MKRAIFVMNHSGELYFALREGTIHIEQLHKLSAGTSPEPCSFVVFSTSDSLQSCL